MFMTFSKAEKTESAVGKMKIEDLLNAVRWGLGEAPHLRW
jgi:hypothetical protein